MALITNSSAEQRKDSSGKEALLPARRNRTRLRLVTRRERWGLSWTGWIVLLVTLGGAAAFIFFHLYPFLAVTERFETNTLVVEGWIPDFAIKGGAEEFRAGKYERVFVTGGPLSGTGGYSNDYNTSASVGATRLRACGLSAEIVQMVPSRVMVRDRTYGSAMALRDWFAEHQMHPGAINVVTESTHARRTRLIFQKAFDRELRVGVIPVQNPDYESPRWWEYSEAVKDVITETVAYLYAKLLFHPSASEPGVKPVR